MKTKLLLCSLHSVLAQQSPPPLGEGLCATPNQFSSLIDQIIVYERCGAEFNFGYNLYRLPLSNKYLTFRSVWTDSLTPQQNPTIGLLCSSCLLHSAIYNANTTVADGGFLSEVPSVPIPFFSNPTQ
jgi:hypothetical protein